MKRYLMIGAAAAVSFPGSLSSQERPDTVRLREVVVTATRLETSIADAPGGITVLSGESMRDSGHRFLVDALRTVPGVAVAKSAGPGSLTSLFMRGGEGNYVQVLVDGVQINDPGGSFDWAHLRTEDVERVEIARGPASVLYGSDAVAGVVQIFTRSGGAPRIEAGVTGSRGDKQDAGAGGSFDTRSVDASLTGQAVLRPTGRTMLRYGLSGAHAASTGLFAFNSDYDNSSAAGRLQLEDERGDIALTARVTDHEYHYPTSGSGAVVDRNQVGTGGTRSFGVDGGYRITAPVELRILATLHDTDARTDDPPDDAEVADFWSTTDQLRRSIDGRVNIGMHRSTVLTLGAEREWQEAQTAFESVSEFGTFFDKTDEARTNTGWYAQLHGSPMRSVSLTIGGRIDDNEKFGTFRTGRAAASWRIIPSLRLHASIGTAFKEPTFFENFATGFTRGDPDLEPEQVRSGEAGAEYVAFRGGLVIGASWFDQRFRDLIQYTFNTPTPEDPNYYNIGAARARGLELNASVQTRALTASASYTHTSTRVTDDGFGEDMSFQSGRRLLRRPTHQASVNASLRLTSAATALLGARYTGDRDDLDFTDPAQFNGIRTTLGDHAVVDAGLVYGIVRGNGPTVDISAGVRNVFDRVYQEIYNFPTPGRVLHLGFRAGVGL